MLIKIAFALLAFTLFCCFLFVIPKEQPLPTPDAPAALYETRNDNLKALVIQAIRQANSSVLLIIYSLRDRDVIEALHQKAEEGVDVTVICDAKASKDVAKPLGKKVNILRRYSEGLMHQKILVIDEAQVWIGSANLTQESLDHHHNLITAFVSPDIAQTITHKASLFKEYGPCEPVKTCCAQVGGQQISFGLLPDEKAGVKHIRSLIQSAKKTIKVAMFTFTRFDFAKDLVDAHNRGVEVAVALDRGMSKGAGQKVAAYLKKNGIPLYISEGKALLHHKFAYIDNSTLINGSANWTKAAFTQNEDCFMILYELTPNQSASMDSLWNNLLLETSLQ